MGLLSFVKDAGEKVWDAIAGNHADQSAKLKEHIQKIGLPGADKVNIDVAGEEATVTGDNISQELKEKFGRDSDLLIMLDGHIPSNDLVVHRF